MTMDKAQKLKLTRSTKTGYLLLDMVIKFIALWPIGTYTAAQNYESLPFVLGAIAFSWIAATALYVLGRIMLIGIKAIHEEQK
jgi:hypothetical protein